MNDQNINSVFLFKLELANKQFRKYKNRIFKKKGIDITSDQWVLLKNIHEVEGINQTELGKKSKKEAAAITRTLDIMERKGWIVREVNDQSRRAFNLFTTKEGKKMVKKVLPIALKVRQQASLDFSKEEMLLLDNLLNRIYQNLK